MKFEDSVLNFLSNLELTNRESTLVVARNNALRDRLRQNAPFTLDTSKESVPLYGSYERDSQIRPKPDAKWALDVDALVVLESSKKNLDSFYHIGDGGWSLLGEVEKILKGYQGLEVTLDAPCVTTKWSTLKMKIEITPAFNAKGGGFLIPSSSAEWVWGNKWVHTNPLGDSKALSDGNKACNFELKPLIKALKCWNREHKILSSFAIESLAYRTAVGNYKGFGYQLQWFFEQLLKLNGNTILPPSGIGSPIKIDLGWNTSIVEDSLNKVRDAYFLADVNASRQREAIGKMARVFGPAFPLHSQISTLGFFR
ncbi:MAG: hypothetical protein PHY93_20260 [Bacteriovorax sp.]|nr:hypothetical protein [Bacteriovorax sp.]